MSEYSDIAAEAMLRACNCTPIGFQLDIITRILDVMSHRTSLEPILMIQSTGSGKYTVPLTDDVLDGGTLIMIEIKLSLGSDQSAKVNQIVASSTKLRVQK